ncbi:low molecular weight phosphatase family protein [Microbacterium sp. NPDC091313]
MLDLDLSGLFAPRDDAAASPTIEILTVCTGNVCRSPLAEQLLRARLRPLDVAVSSAGTKALIDKPMEPDAAHLAAQLGIDPADSAAHRGRWLSEKELRSPDLVLALTREHRRDIVELSPARIRSVFTAREFERLSRDLSDAEIRATADAAGSDPHARVRAVVELLGSRRGQLEQPADPADDDVVDPYRRSWETYQRSAAELLPAIAEIVRVFRATIG